MSIPELVLEVLLFATTAISREKLYTPLPPLPFFGQEAFFMGEGGVYILKPPPVGILYAPLFYTPPTLRRVFPAQCGKLVIFGVLALQK